MLPRAPLFVLLTSALVAQAPRLVDTIESPLAYLCLEGGSPEAGGQVAGGLDAGALEAGGLDAGKATAGRDREAGAVRRLLADPSLDALFGERAAVERAAVERAAVERAAVAGSHGAPPTVATASGRALTLVRGVIARTSGELEIALTGVMTNGGTPLLVLRARLQPAESDRLRGLFDDPGFAVPQRQLGGCTTYRLHGDSEREAAGAGERVELALVGNDLVAGNDGYAMRELLDPNATGTTASASTVLSANPRFVAMRKNLQSESGAVGSGGTGTGAAGVPAPGSLWIYGDWQRLASRFHRSFDGLPGDMLASSGLGQARSLMVSIAPRATANQPADFAATLLLDFEARPADRAADHSPDGARPWTGPGHREFDGIDGWFAAAHPVPARTLVAELPTGGSGVGMGGLVLSVDFEEVASRSHEGDHIVHDLQVAFEQYGLSFDRNVRARLGTRGTVQFQLQRTDGAVASVSSTFSLRVKDKKAAGDLFSDLRRVAEAAGLGRLIAGKPNGDHDRRAPDVLQLHAHHHDAGFVLAVFEESLLLATDLDTLLQVHEDLRRSSKPRTRRDQFVSSKVQSIGGENVAGLFDVDLQPLFEEVVKVFGDAGAKVDLSQLPRRHVGYLDLPERGAGNVDSSLVRVRVLSSR